MATTALLTIEQYEQLPDTGVRTELVDGEVIELATGNWLHDWVRDGIRTTLRRGYALAEREFRTAEGRVRRADVVWLGPLTIGSADLSRSLSSVPDLVVEVVSPNDLAVPVHNKVSEYLDAGVAAVWVVYLETRDGEVWNRGRTAMTGVETLTADCLPGFTLQLESIFPEL